MSEKDAATFARRDILKQIATVAGAAPLTTTVLATTTTTTAAIVSTPAEAAPTATPVPVAGYQSLSPTEAAFVETFVNVMCPADHLTPNGVDCGLATFIDRQLAGGFGQGENVYMHGPWRQGKPQLGYQLPLSPEQFFKAGVAAANAACQARFGKDFDALPATDADAFLQDLSKGKVTDPRVPLGLWFNDLAYPLFVQACFADPIYGGNGDKVFWRMIGYPGLPATHTRDMVEYRGKPYPGAKDPKSIADFS
jgi:gluconate 2-dehydrogenase gamma chain